MSSFSENSATNLLKEEPINFVKYLFECLVSIFKSFRFHIISIFNSFAKLH